MKYTSELDDKSGICTVRVTGEYRRPGDSDRLKRFAVEFAAKHKCGLFLFDLSQADVISGTYESFEAGNPQGEFAEKLKHVKTAMVRNCLTEDDYYFETVAVNRGYLIRVFKSAEAAMKWLKSSET